MRFLSIALLSLVSISLISCKHNNTSNIKHDLEQIITTRLYLPQTASKNNYNYLILRYIKPSSCTSCQLEMGKWRVYKRQLENKFNSTVGLIFIIETVNLKEVDNLSSMYNFKDNIYIDSIGEFIEMNKVVKPFGKDVVMLLDSSLSVIAVGNDTVSLSVSERGTKKGPAKF